MQIKTMDTTRMEEIEKRYQVSALSARVLASKQLSDAQIKELLCAPRLSDPMLANGMENVIKRIALAKANKEKVMVCGDYDTDGICATAILVDALRRFGITCGFYIPNRFKEGYGLQPHTVTMAKDKGYSLLITVDNGVKAFAALQQAQAQGMDVIVSDHHAMEASFPCLLLLHPQYMGERFETLSGAGVALMMARALVGDVKEHIVLACVAAIADVMPLVKETRAIVKLGISYLREGVCIPIQRLANDRYPVWNETMIAFQIVPKLNATGRLADMANANNTVRYLLLDHHDAILHMAKQIQQLNEQRKEMSQKMIETARSLVREEYGFQLLFHDRFHEGMAGLVAGKLQEELHRPIMVATKRNGMYKGSIRSGKLLDLTTFFVDCMPHLQAYGGHKAAAGIGFLCEEKQAIQDYVNTRMQHVPQIKEEGYDVIAITMADMCMAQVESLQQLAPFGAGFEEPLFYIPNVVVKQMKLLSNQTHIKWVLSDACEAMYFQAHDKIAALQNQSVLNMVGHLTINTFRQQKKVSILVVDVEY